jgi:hypothetical protein
MGISDINMSSGLIPSKILTNPSFFSTVNQTLKKQRDEKLYIVKLTPVTTNPLDSKEV